MASGIYKLTFKSGKYYIGKSNDIERRWLEHENKFYKGTAAKNMQTEFNAYGYPNKGVLFYCHEDHIDIMEALYIQGSWGPNILNAAQPSTITSIEQEWLLHNTELLTIGTPAHCKMIKDYSDKIKELENESILWRKRVSSIVEGTALEEAEEELVDAYKELNDIKRENNRIKSRGLFARIFNN